MANRWGNNGNSDRLYSGGLQITGDGDCSHEIKRLFLAPWKKSYDQPRQHIKKQRHYLANNGPSKCRRIDAFELWCWRKLLRVPWIARRLNQSILKEVIPEYSLERLMLKLKLLWPPDVKK